MDQSITLTLAGNDSQLLIYKIFCFVVTFTLSKTVVEYLLIIVMFIFAAFSFDIIHYGSKSSPKSNEKKLDF